MKAGPLREEAYAKLVAARELVDEEGNLKDVEDEPKFNGLMAEFRDLNEQAAKAAETDGNVSAMRENFEMYSAKLTGQPMRFSTIQLDRGVRKSPGAQFVESETYKRLKESGAFTGPDTKFRSDRVVVGSRLPFGAAASDIINTNTGENAASLVQPFRPGVMLPYGQAPTVIRDLFANEDMPSGDTVEYAAQVGFDNAAAAVAQAADADTDTAAGGLKPQSSVAWEERTAKATWIATWMAATRQALEDETQLRSLIDNQGRLMIRIAEDEQLLNGNGTPPNLTGILDDGNTGLQTLDLTGEDNLDGLRTARRLVQTGLSRLQPTFVVLNPEDSEEFDLLKDLNLNYRGGNPIGNFDFNLPIWRLQRVESEAIDVGIALVGARAGATVYERTPLSVLVAEQHADFFVRNLVVILFEERIAFPIYFPTAFVEVTLADWGAGS